MKKPDIIKKDAEMEAYDSEMAALKHTLAQTKRDAKKIENDFTKQESLREKHGAKGQQINKDKNKIRDVTNLDGLGFLRDHQREQKEQDADRIHDSNRYDQDAQEDINIEANSGTKIEINHQTNEPESNLDHQEDKEIPIKGKDD